MSVFQFEPFSDVITCQCLLVGLESSQIYEIFCVCWNGLFTDILIVVMFVVSLDTSRTFICKCLLDSIFLKYFNLSTYIYIYMYRVIKNDCRGFNNSPGHLVLQMQPHVISFYGVTSRIRFMFLPQVSGNWRYESEPPLKPSPLTCYKQFGTNSIIVLMSVE